MIDAASVTRAIRVGGWLRIELSGDERALDRLLHRSRDFVAPAEAKSPHARVRLAASGPRSPRWLDRALTHSVIEWTAPARGRARMQSADATLRWDGTASDVLCADLSLDTRDATALQTALKLFAVLLGVAHRRRLLVHASAVLVDGRAVLFLGDSGAGKSTTAERLEAEGLHRVADDAVFVEVGDELRVFPYFGDCVFGTLAAPDAGWPLCTVMRIAKHAPASRVEIAGAQGVRRWFESLIVPPGPPAYGEAVIDAVAELAHRSVATLAAAETGPLRPALNGFLGC